MKKTISLTRQIKKQHFEIYTILNNGLEHLNKFSKAIENIAKKYQQL